MDKKPEYMDYITQLCMVACSDEEVKENRCICINDSKNYQEALRQWEKENGK